MALLGIVLLLIAAAGAAIAALKGVDTHGATVRRYEIRSALVHGTLPQVAVVPAHAAERPGLLVFLHGKGQDQESL